MTIPRILHTAPRWLTAAIAIVAMTGCETVPHDRRYEPYGQPAPSGYIYSAPPVIYPAQPHYDRDNNWRAREQRREYERERAEDARRDREREREQARLEQARRERAENDRRAREERDRRAREEREQRDRDRDRNRDRGGYYNPNDPRIWNNRRSPGETPP